MSTATKTPRRVRTTEPYTRTFRPFANCWEEERLINVQRVQLASVCGARRNYEWRTIGRMGVTA